MPLTISLQFPAGRYVAASWSDKDTVEWPPHPARLFLGLVDVLHKAGNLPQQREALQWLCEQAAPGVVVPSDAHCSLLAMDGFFVPQNPAQAEHGIKHPRKAPSFPSVCVADDQPTVLFQWDGIEVPAEHRGPLRELVEALPRFGHSSSFVVARISESEWTPEGEDWRVLLPFDGDAMGSPDFSLRVNHSDLLSSAETSFQAEERAKELAGLIQRNSKPPKDNATLKPAASPRGRHDPRHRWQGYCEKQLQPVVGSLWDARLLILKLSGDRMGLQSTWQLAEVFHKTLLDRWQRAHGDEPIPSWLSGHRPREGREVTGPSRSCHLAILPLPFVDHEYATGHLLGLALALPKAEKCGLEPLQMKRDWRRALAALLSEEILELVPNDQAWRVQLSLDDSPDPRRALTNSYWTKPSHSWRTVTPIILDRHPKPPLKKDPEAWHQCCEAIIATACQRSGLPTPISIRVFPVSSLKGVPPAGTFQPPKAREGRPPRFHIHAEIQFAEPVQGPLSLGAGRFRGYGFCLPTSNQEHPSE